MRLEMSQRLLLNAVQPQPMNRFPFTLCQKFNIMRSFETRPQFERLHPQPGLWEINPKCLKKIVKKIGLISLNLIRNIFTRFNLDSKTSLCKYSPRKCLCPKRRPRRQNSHEDWSETQGLSHAELPGTGTLPPSTDQLSLILLDI